MPNRTRRTRTKKSTTRKLPYTQSENPNDWLDRLASFNANFGRFTRDVFGVLLIALALMSLLALLGLTQGVLLTPWAGLLRLWLGWGSYLIVLAVALAGALTLRRGVGSFRWGRLIALELAALLSLALLSVITGHSVMRADAGYDGGRLGWGLSQLAYMFLGPSWGMLVLAAAWLLTMAGGLGLWPVLQMWLLRLSSEAGSPRRDSPAVELQELAEAAPPVARKPKEKKRSVRLPPEFRKSLHIPESQDHRLAVPPPRDERLPPFDILAKEQFVRPDEQTVNQTAGLIEKTLNEFGIPAQVIGFRIGPTVTQFAVQPGFIEKSGNGEDAQRMKVRVAQIASLQRDLALALSAERLRIEAPVPGRSYVGLEVPNSRSSVVRLRPVLESESFYKVNSPLAIALGRDVSGQPVVADLARMPHLLIAGATGSGKSVCITALAACLVMNNAPEDMRLVMIDSKMVELIRFNGLPHLYGKVETDIERIMAVLRWMVIEMERRYKLLEATHSRDIDSYNRKLQRKHEGTPIPRIVVMIDEMADLMLHAPDQTEHNLVRLAQMARATGIHLVVATQRPSTDVVTGLIKANFPARLAFAVASGVDSRVILDMGGAEHLLGRGDMLFLNPEAGSPLRSQGVMVADQEIERIITYWQKMSPADGGAPPWERLVGAPDQDEEEALVEQAISLVRQTQRASASLLQRRLQVGYPRAARLLDQLEEMGVVGPSQGGGRGRDVLIDPVEETSEETSDSAG
jgi:S-DNA-T family DNA segregation ATPase FtsK/SpoIIIE